MYQAYAVKRMLPTRRMEMHFAQLTRILMQVNGNPDVVNSDFLFDAPEENPPEATAADAQQFFGFKPRKKKV